MLLPCLIAIFLIDTQGYSIPYKGLFLIPIGAFVTVFFRRNFFLAMLILCLGFFPLTTWINWELVQQAIQTGGIRDAEIEGIGDAILAKTLLDKTETIVATHELIWVLAAYPNFYSPMAEGQSPELYGWTDLELWENLAPDVYIEIPSRLLTPEGLQQYLENEQFQLCQDFQANSVRVYVWRRNCQ